MKYTYFPAMDTVDSRFRIHTGPVSQETVKIAEEQLLETPERVREALESLREMVRGKILEIHWRNNVL